MSRFLYPFKLISICVPTYDLSQLHTALAYYTFYFGCSTSTWSHNNMRRWRNGSQSTAYLKQNRCFDLVMLYGSSRGVSCLAVVFTIPTLLTDPFHSLSTPTPYCGLLLIYILYYVFQLSIVCFSLMSMTKYVCNRLLWKPKQNDKI